MRFTRRRIRWLVLGTTAGLAWLGAVRFGWLNWLGCSETVPQAARIACDVGGGGPESVFFWVAPTLAATLIIASGRWLRCKQLLLACVGIVAIEVTTYTVLGILISGTFRA